MFFPLQRLLYWTGRIPLLRRRIFRALSIDEISKIFLFLSVSSFEVSVFAGDLDSVFHFSTFNLPAQVLVFFLSSFQFHFHIEFTALFTLRKVQSTFGPEPTLFFGFQSSDLNVFCFFFPFAFIYKSTFMSFFF